MLHRPRTAALIAAACLVVAACTNDDPEQIDASDDPPETAPPPTEDPADAATDDGNGNGDGADDGPELAEGAIDLDAEPLYPPLPELEPDPRSEIPVEDQAFFLDLHARTYEITQEAIATGDADRDRLAEVLAGDELDLVIATIEDASAQDAVSRSPDTEVAWVDVASAEDDSAVVLECLLIGPRSGLYDERTGELLDPAEDEEPLAALLVATYEAQDPDDRDTFRAVAFEASSNEEVCDV